MIRRPPRSTQSRSSAASDVYKRQTSVRNDAVAAVLVAAANDGDSHGYRDPVGVALRRGNTGGVSIGRREQPRRKLLHLRWGNEEIHEWVPLLQFGLIGAGHAAGHTEQHLRLAGLDRLEVAQLAVNPVFGALANAAAVQDSDVGVLEAIRGSHARGVEQLREPAGVGSVHLAAAHPEIVSGDRQKILPAEKRAMMSLAPSI